VPKNEWQEFTNWTCCSPELCLVGYELMQLQAFERVGVMILSGKGNKKVEQPEVRKQREVLDDFVRNFCMTYGLMKTLEVFEVSTFCLSFVIFTSLWVLWWKRNYEEYSKSISAIRIIVLLTPSSNHGNGTS
jgi:hypothetical protein